MKRMNEVFELPLKAKNLQFVVDDTSLEDDAAIIHAINNVDKLADALENLIPYCFGGNEEAMNAWAEAKDVLAAYRGEEC
jgi:hypothetical protein